MKLTRTFLSLCLPMSTAMVYDFDFFTDENFPKGKIFFIAWLFYHMCVYIYVYV